MRQELGIQDYLDLMFKHKSLIIISTLSIFLSVMVYTITRPPVYESTSTFMLETRNIGFSEAGLALTQQTRPLEYYQAIMESRIFRSRARNTLFHVDSSNTQPEFNERELVKAIQKGLSLNSAEYSDFVQLKAKTNDAQLAFRVASVATEVLKNRCQEIDREEQQNAVRFIEEQQLISKQKLEDTERALQQFKDVSSMVVVDEEGGLIEELVQLENELTRIQTEKELASATLNAYKRRIEGIQGPDQATASDMQSPRVRQLYTDITQLEDRKNDLIVKYGSNSPEITSIEKQIEAKRQDMVAALINNTSKEDDDFVRMGDVSLWESMHQRKVEEELTVFALENKERYYKTLIENFKKKHPEMMTQAIELMRLSREKEVAGNLYNFLIEKGEEAKIKAATGTGGIRIIDAPMLPTEPVPVNTIRNLLMGLFIGLGLGLGLAYFKEYTDNSIKTQEDITTFLHLPVMGIIPNLIATNGLKTRLSFLNEIKRNTESGNGQNNFKTFLISQMKSKNPVVESYRSLRSNLEFANMDHSIRTIIISSPNPSEGKTLTTANLGIVFALLGKHVIIVDTDLRKPKQHKLFGIDRAPGLTDCLVEDFPISDVVYRTGIDNLELIPCGKTPPNPAEILASKKMNDVMQEINNKADLILYDSPPLVAVTDPVLLASRMDGILLVVKHRGTNRAVAADMVDLLKKARVNIIGVVMNQALITRGYGYYKYYTKYYK